MGAPNVFTIFTGDDKTIYLKAAQGSCSGDPLDLTSCTEIDIALPNADGTFTHLLLSDDQVTIVSPSLLGKFSALIESDVSEVLNVGEFQNLDVTFTIGAVTFTVRYFQSFSVFEKN